MTFQSASDAVSFTRSGLVSAVEAVADQLELLHRCHESLHAVESFEDDYALREAARLDALFVQDRDQIGPLHGLAITVKDWIDVAGFPCAGTTGPQNRRPAADATVIRRLREAGAVVIAKTKAWGPAWPDSQSVRHPTHSDRTPGGSSTGEAVAVAARGSLVGVGSDSGGSIRLPAAWCGVFGFKPTAGLVPTTGHFPKVGERHDGRTQIGPIARTIADLRLLLEVIAGPDGLDSAAPPVRLNWETVSSRPSTFAVVARDPAVGPVDVDVLAALDSTATRLERFGLARVDWTAPWLTEGFDITRRYWNRSKLSGAEVDQHLSDWDRFRYRYRRASETVDFLLTPTTTSVAPVQGPVELEHFVFTVPASLTGSPAIAIPIAMSADNLPISVQVIGRPWEDPQVLAVAEMLESNGLAE